MVPQTSMPSVSRSLTSSKYCHGMLTIVLRTRIGFQYTKNSQTVKQQILNNELRTPDQSALGH